MNSIYDLQDRFYEVNEGRKPSKDKVLHYTLDSIEECENIISDYILNKRRFNNEFINAVLLLGISNIVPNIINYIRKNGTIQYSRLAEDDPLKKRLGELIYMLSDSAEEVSSFNEYDTCEDSYEETKLDAETAAKAAALIEDGKEAIALAKTQGIQEVEKAKQAAQAELNKVKAEKANQLKLEKENRTSEWEVKKNEGKQNCVEKNNQELEKAKAKQAEADKKIADVNLAKRKDLDGEIEKIKSKEDDMIKAYEGAQSDNMLMKQFGEDGGVTGSYKPSVIVAEDYKSPDITPKPYSIKDTDISLEFTGQGKGKEKLQNDVLENIKTKILLQKWDKKYVEGLNEFYGINIDTSISNFAEYQQRKAKGTPYFDYASYFMDIFGKGDIPQLKNEIAPFKVTDYLGTSPMQIHANNILVDVENEFAMELGQEIDNYEPDYFNDDEDVEGYEDDLFESFVDGYLYASELGFSKDEILDVYENDEESFYGFAKKAKSIAKKASNTVSKPTQSIKSVARTVSKPTQAVRGVTKSVSNTSRVIRSEAKSAGKTVQNQANSTTKQVKGAAKQVKSHVKDAQKTANKLKNQAQKTAKHYAEQAKKIAEKAKDKISETAQKLQQNINNFVEKAKKVISETAKFYANQLQDISKHWLKEISKIATKIAHAVVSATKWWLKIIEKAAKFYVQMLKKLGELVGKIAKAIKKALDKAFQALAKAFGGILNTIMKLMVGGGKNSFEEEEVSDNSEPEPKENVDDKSEDASDAKSDVESSDNSESEESESNISAKREKIAKIVETIMNILTFGQWNSLKNSAIFKFLVGDTLVNFVAAVTDRSKPFNFLEAIGMSDMIETLKQMREKAGILKSKNSGDVSEFALSVSLKELFQNITPKTIASIILTIVGFVIQVFLQPFLKLICTATGIGNLVSWIFSIKPIMNIVEKGFAVLYSLLMGVVLKQIPEAEDIGDEEGEKGDSFSYESDFFADITQDKEFSFQSDAYETERTEYFTDMEIEGDGNGYKQDKYFWK